MPLEDVKIFGQPTNQARCILTAFNLGDSISTNQVNYHGDYLHKKKAKEIYRGQTIRVGSLPNENNLGLSDTHGNVSEWVQDKYDKYPFDKNNHHPVVDPQDSSLRALRVIRGGSWYNQGPYVRLAYRKRWPPYQRFNSLGFRLVRTVKSL